jgi:hypothetical protein
VNATKRFQQKQAIDRAVHDRERLREDSPEGSASQQTLCKRMKPPTPNPLSAMTPYRVQFTELEATGVEVYSTGWFASLAQAENCRWMRQDNARIVRREFSPAVLKESLTTEPLSFA